MASGRTADGALRVAAAAALVACLGCRSAPPAAPASPEAARPPGPPAATLRRFDLLIGDLHGISDLAVAGDGLYFAVPERQRFLVPISITIDPAGLAAPPLPLRGIAEGTDTEAIARLGPRRLALGTETQEEARDHDDILFVDTDGVGEARVSGSLGLPYALWSMTAERNRGIEGLCAAGGVLLAGVETRIAAPGRTRFFAPIGRYDVARRRWTALRLALHGVDGSLSALACREDGRGGMTALAVQRDRRATLLLGFDVPADGPATDLSPTWVLDLKAADASLPNLEGVAFLPDGRALLISDNDSGGVTGPTEAVIVDLPAAASRREARSTPP